MATPGGAALTATTLGHSLAAVLDAPIDAIKSNGPGSYTGPIVGSAQARAVLVATAAAFAGSPRSCYGAATSSDSSTGRFGM